MKNYEYDNLFEARKKQHLFIEKEFYGIEVDDLDLKQLVNLKWHLEQVGRLLKENNKHLGIQPTFDAIWKNYSLDIIDFDYETIFRLADEVEELIKLEKEMEIL